MALSLADELAGAFGGDELGNGGSMSLAEEFGLDMNMNTDMGMDMGMEDDFDDDGDGDGGLELEYGLEHEHEHGPDYHHQRAEEHDATHDYEYEGSLSTNLGVSIQNQKGVDEVLPHDDSPPKRDGDPSSTPPVPLPLLRQAQAQVQARDHPSTIARKGKDSRPANKAKTSLSPRHNLDLGLESEYAHDHDDVSVDVDVDIDEVKLEYRHQYQQGHPFDHSCHDINIDIDKEEDEEYNHTHTREGEESFDAVPDLESEISPFPSPLKLRNTRSKASIKSRTSANNLRGRGSLAELRQPQNTHNRHNLQMDREGHGQGLAQGQGREALIVLSETLGSSSRLLTSLRSLDTPTPSLTTCTSISPTVGTIGISTSTSSNHQQSGWTKHSSEADAESESLMITIEMKLQRHLEKMIDCEKRRDEMIRELSHMEDEAASKLGIGVGIGMGMMATASTSYDSNLDLSLRYNGSEQDPRGLHSLAEGDEDEDEQEEGHTGDGEEGVSPGWTGELISVDEKRSQHPSDRRREESSTTGGRDHRYPGSAETGHERARTHYGYNDTNNNNDNDHSDKNEYDNTNNDDENDNENGVRIHRTRAADKHNDKPRTKEEGKGFAFAHHADEHEIEDQHIDPHDALMEQLDDDDDFDEEQEEEEPATSPSLSPITPSGSSSTAFSNSVHTSSNLAHISLQTQTTHAHRHLHQHQRHLDPPTTGALLPHLTSTLMSDTSSLLSILRQLSETLHTSSSLNTSLARQVKGIKSSLESAKAREEADRLARAGIEDWEASKIRDGLKGDGVGLRMSKELDDFKGRLEDYERILEGFRPGTSGTSGVDRTWIRS